MSILENGRPQRNKREPKAMQFARQLDAGQDLLSDEEKAELRLQAQEDFDKEQKKRQADAFYERELQGLRRAGDPRHELVPVFLQLPGSALYIMLDGKQYFTDTSYPEVPQPVAHVLIEQMNRAWAHEELTEVRDTKSRRRWRPPPGVGYGNFMGQRAPRDMVMSSAEMAGAVASLQRTVVG